ncbi:MAG: hypothetical protein AAB515_01270 [Patescibacteria group bacterium]
MSRRLLLLVASALTLVLLGLGAFLLFGRRQANTDAPTNTATGSVPNVNTVVLNTNNAANTNTATSGSPTDARTTVQNLAKNFASIYGSFSTQNNFQNITDMYFYMAPALRAQQESFVAAEQAKRADTSLYSGTSSEPRTTEVLAFDENAGTAEIKVTLQRTETTGSSSEPTTYFQPITLSFQRLADGWKVERIAWGAKQ